LDDDWVDLGVTVLGTMGDAVGEHMLRGRGDDVYEKLALFIRAQEVARKGGYPRGVAVSCRARLILTAEHPKLRTHRGLNNNMQRKWGCWPWLDQILINKKGREEK